MAKKSKLWIQKALAKRKTGQLHKDLGVKLSKKIPLSKLKVAAKKKGCVGARARLALTLRTFGRKRLNRRRV